MDRAKKIVCTINYLCEVTLTDYGIGIIQKKHPQRLAMGRVDKDTRIYKDELWSLMADFGECMWMGNNNMPFENNEIRIIPEE
jgi:hypothetical protein